MEMSFVDQDDVIALNEKLLRVIWKEFKGLDVESVPVLAFEEAMARFGSDKPDLRISWEIKDLAKTLNGSGFKVFDEALSRGDVVKGLAVPGLGEMARAQFDKLTASAKQLGAKGLIWIKRDEQGQLQSPISKFISEEKLNEILDQLGGQGFSQQKLAGALIVADTFQVSCTVLGFLRVQLAHEMGAVDKSKDRFLWVTDFPLLEYSPADQRWVAVHHPFTAPQDQHLSILEKGDVSQYSKIKAKAYDLVCNGYEIAGGSIRIHRQDVQKIIFQALGFTEAEVQMKFGFFNEALSYGTPPHGGIAWGFDRLAMILCGTDAIRDVIAFPKTTKASCMMSEAPSDVDRSQLLELGIRLERANKSAE
jgi:aspartyl-tRNA synthetase